MSTVLAKWYKLTINGEEISDAIKRRITEITLNVKETGSSTLAIKLEDDEMQFLSSEYLVKEAKVSFKCAWYDSRAKMAEFVGYISVVDTDFGKQTKLTITCMDESFVMDRTEETKKWEKVKVSDVAKEIFQKYGLTPHIDDTKYTEDSISQSNQTDANFMNSLVGKVTDKVFIWYVTGKDGYFVERKMLESSSSTLGFKTGNNQIQSFNPRLTKGKLKVKKTSANVDSKTGKTHKTVTTAEPSESTKNNKAGTNKGTATGKSSSGKSMKYNSKTKKWRKA